MSTLRLRILRRNTSLEVPFEDFYRTEFRGKTGDIDTELSVYDIDPTDTIRAHAEHAVSFASDPANRHGVALDGLEGAFVEVDSPGETAFAYTNERHKELRFMRESEVEDLAARIYKDLSKRARPATRNEVLQHAEARLDARDPEWLNAVAAKPKWWKAIQKRKASSPREAPSMEPSEGG